MDEAPFPLGRSATDLHGEDEGLIDTKGLLRRDEQGGGASERAGRQEALAVHLSDHSLVGALQHPVGERTHAVSAGHGGGGEDRIASGSSDFHRTSAKVFCWLVQ